MIASEAAAASEPGPQPAEAQPETPAVAAEPSAEPEAPAEQTVAAAPQVADASTQPAAGRADSDTAADDDGIVTVTAAPLQAVDSAVIIRRGDTLWRISRRVYGRGVRYSTIYLANQEQIEDPDRIWPGQVFRVPDKTTEGETADLDPIRAQVTSVEPAATAQ